MKDLWTKTSGGTYVTEASDLGRRMTPLECPKCNRTVFAHHATGVDLHNGAGPSDGDIAGWRYTHPCGAKLLIIND